MAGKPVVERGSIIIWAALSLVVLITFLAIVLNAGHLMTARGELQNAVDSAALAGALQLNGNETELTPAETLSDQYGAQHRSDRYRVAPDDIWLGQWTRFACDAKDTATDFTNGAYRFCRVTDADAAAAFRINGVYVHAQRAGVEGGAGGGGLPVFLGGILGRDRGATMTRAADAIAVTGGPCQSTSCLNIPMVIGVGCLTDTQGGAACDPAAPPDSPGPMYQIGLSSTAFRSAGWSIFTTNPPSDSALCTFLQQDLTTCHELNLNDQIEVAPVDIGQGNKFNGGCNPPKKSKGQLPPGVPDKNAHVCDWFKQFASSATPIEVPVISSTGSLSEACPSTYNGTAYVVGFATFNVLAVYCGGSPPDCVSPPGTDYCTNPPVDPATGQASPCPSSIASEKCILTQLVCNHKPGGNGTSTGCAWTGTSPLRPILVH